MSVQANKAQFQRFLTFINTADKVLGEDLIAEDAIFHAPNSPEPMRGIDGYMAILAMMRSGFPDIQWTIEEIVAEGDRLAARFTMRGRHTGAFFGIPPTGKEIAVQAINFYRFAEGRIIEEHGQPDLMGLMRQIGG